MDLSIIRTPYKRKFPGYSGASGGRARRPTTRRRLTYIPTVKKKTWIPRNPLAKIHRQTHNGSMVDQVVTKGQPVFLTVSDLAVGGADTQRRGNRQMFTSIALKGYIGISQYPGVLEGQKNYLYCWEIIDRQPTAGNLTTYSDVFWGVHGKPSTYYARKDQSARFKVSKKRVFNFQYPVLNGGKPDNSHDQDKPFELHYKPDVVTEWNDSDQYVKNKIYVMMQFEKEWSKPDCVHKVHWCPTTNFHAV